MITVTKTYLPELSKVSTLMEQIWLKGQVTNNGIFVRSLEDRLKRELGIRNFQFVSNGTIAIQLLVKMFNFKGKVLTTPFSYVATTNSLLWENCTPVFVDISPDTLNVNASKIEELIDEEVSGMLFTHVFGVPCEVEKIKEIADKYKLPVIYDAAHAFGVKYKGTSLLNYGNASTLSFHATKIFHSIEGGGVVVHSDKQEEEIFLLKSFGHKGDNYISQGINGKNSEIHAAIGHCVLDDLQLIFEKRKTQYLFYLNELKGLEKINLQVIPALTEYNYSYFPVIFESEKLLLKVIKNLNEVDVFPRRYFYPSLNTLPFVKGEFCPVSESIAPRILCLPLYFELTETDQKKIIDEIKSAL